MVHRHRTYNGILSLLFMLHDDYFIRLFYYRLGVVASWISWLRPGDKIYQIECQWAGWGRHSFATILSAQSIGKNFSHKHSTTFGNKIDTITVLPNGSIQRNTTEMVARL